MLTVVRRMGFRAGVEWSLEEIEALLVDGMTADDVLVTIRAYRRGVTTGLRGPDPLVPLQAPPPG